MLLGLLWLPGLLWRSGTCAAVTGITATRRHFPFYPNPPLGMTLCFLLTGLLRSRHLRHLLEINKNRIFWLWRLGIRQVIQQGKSPRMQQQRQYHKVQK